PQVADFASMIPADLSTADPLGIGGLLRDTLRADRLHRAGLLDDALPRRLIDNALVSLDAYGRTGELAEPAEHRLAFRELGLAIGLAAVPALVAAHPRDAAVARVERHLATHSRIEEFWLRPANRLAPSWLDHQNINDVMLA